MPNHQVGRTTPFRTRGDVAFTGAFGYELDLGALTEDEKNEVKRQTAFYKKSVRSFSPATFIASRTPTPHRKPPG